MTDTPQPYTRPLAIDLFAGAGGLSLGLEQAGFDVVAAVEYDPVHAAVHEYNFPNTATLCRDVSTLTGTEIRDRVGIGDREVHVVAGGPPCQGISLMGKRAIDDPRNSLLREFARIVAETRPRYFIMENVAGLTVGEYRNLLDDVVAMMGDAGYRVVQPYKVLQAADYGTPQHRRRLFLLGARHDVALPAYPTPLVTPRSIKGIIPSPSGLPLGPSVWDAIGDLPDANGFEELLDTDSVTALAGALSPYAAVLSGQACAPDDFSHPRPHDPTVLTCSTRTHHSETIIARFTATEPGATEKVSRFLRLHPDGLCNTLRAGTASDRGAHTAARPIHPLLPRVITVREAARLHGYPDWFRFHATKWGGYRQIGNSVPPPLARAVAGELLRADRITPCPGVAHDLGDPALLSMNASEAQRHFGITERVIAQRNRAAR